MHDAVSRADDADAGARREAAGTAGLLNRIESVITEEISALNRQDLSQIEPLSERKARCLLELIRLSRMAPGGLTRHQTADQIKSLRRLLETDRRLIAVQIEATALVARLLSETLHRAESDGTYAPRRATDRAAT
jgi:hypothetical protein